MAIADERVGRVVPEPLAMLLVREGILYVDLRYGVNLEDATPDLEMTEGSFKSEVDYALAGPWG